MPGKKISVVIPVYNEEKHLSHCLSSLLSQTRIPDEIILIDDGSKDRSEEVAKRYPIILLKSNHQGPGKARNLGVKKAKGGVIVFVDADMTFDKKFIESLVKPIESGKSKGVFNVDEYVANYSHPLARSWNINCDLYDAHRFNANSIEDTEDFRAILKTEFERVGGFDDTGYTDSRTLVRKLGYRPDPVSGAVSYHANPESFSEIFVHARWMGKRDTKYGLMGKLVNVIRYSFPSSLVMGIYKSIRTKTPQFLFFKIVYDLGYSCGIFLSILSKNKSK